MHVHAWDFFCGVDFFFHAGAGANLILHPVGDVLCCRVRWLCHQDELGRGRIRQDEGGV